MNDIATMGAIPKWFLATLLFPEGSDLRIIEKVFRQIHHACRRFRISFIGGHTEITPGIKKTILSGHMIGEVKKDKLVTTSGARAGDLLLLVKGVCIEGTSIIAREKEAELLKKGISSYFIPKAKRIIFNPGIDILRSAQIACQTASIHSMHDPTEGGLINGFIEMARASEKGIEIDLEKVNARGLRDLIRYLDFARSGKLPSRQGESKISEIVHEKDPFLFEIQHTLEQNGLRSKLYLGASKFKRGFERGELYLTKRLGG